MSYQQFFDFAKILADAAQTVIQPWYFNQSLEVETKSDASPVTIADRAAEKRMRELIESKYPEHGVIGEEFGNSNAEAEFVWVLDPIDGTKSFASGCPLFGTLIALLHGGKPVVGAINLPALNQLCISDGSQTLLNGKPVRVRNTEHLQNAVLLTTDVNAVGKYQSAKNFDQLMQQTRFTRTWGDCYGYVLVASGWSDIMIDPEMNPWDLMALVPVIRGAGGVITDWQGNDPVTGNSIVAAAPALHPQVIDILNR